MPNYQQAPAKVVDQIHPAHLWMHEVVVPNDGLLHPLDELGFGYFAAPIDPAGSKRAIRGVEVRNPIEQANTGLTLFIGGVETGATPAAELIYGMSRYFTVNYLGSLAVQNPNADLVILEVVLVAMDE